MDRDPVVERIREIKREIAREFDYDIHKFAEYIRTRQERSRDRLVNTAKVVKEEGAPVK